jgi:hypothetical protein
MGDDALSLQREAAAEARVLYPESHDPGTAALEPANQPTPHRGLYLVAYAKVMPVGMGAHCPLNETTNEVRSGYWKRVIGKRRP